MKRSRDFILFPHQKEAVDAILKGFTRNLVLFKTGYPKHANCFLLYDEMGLGKSFSALSAIKKSMENESPEAPTLIICPAGLIHVWEEYHYKDLRVVGHHDNFDDINGDTIVVVSLTTLGNAFKEALYNGDCDETRLKKIYEKKKIKKMKKSNNNKHAWLINTCWHHVVIDEAHKVRNGTNVNAKAVAYLDAKYRLALTGTPIYNSGCDIMNILKYALGLFDLNWVKIANNLNNIYFQRTLREISLGRTRDDIGGKKRVKHDDNMIISWGNYPKERALYRKLKAKSLSKFKDINEIYQKFGELDSEFQQRKRQNIQTFLATVQALRQACLATPKIETLLDIYDGFKQKIVVFSAYKTFFVERLQPVLEEKSHRYALFCGGTKKSKQKALKSFKEEEDVQFLLVVKGAGSLGLNLQGMASVVVIMEPHFNISLDNQASHRVDRIGQTKDVYIKRLFMQGSIDIAMLNLQNEKKKVEPTKNLSFKASGMFLKKHDTV